MLTAFMLLTPLLQSPDEQSHIDRVVDTGNAGFQEFDENGYSSDMLESFRILELSQDPDPFSAGNAPLRPQQPLGDLSAANEGSGVNQIANHPPAYYAWMGGLRTTAAGLLPMRFWQFDLEFLLLRILNIILMAPLPWILSRTVLNLGMPIRAAWAASLLPLTIPQLAHIGSSVNNDNLLVMASSLSLMYAAKVLSQGLTTPIALAMSGCAAVAVQSKVFGLMLGPFLAVVCLVSWSRNKREWPNVLLVGGILVLSTWTYIRNLLLYGEIYPTLAPPGAPPDVEPFPVDWSVFLSHWIGQTSSSFWGYFGWLHLPLPGWFTTTLSLLIVGVLLIALVRPAAKYVGIMLIPVGIVLAMYFVSSLDSHMRTGVFPAQQGRYLFPVLGSLAVALASATLGLRPRWTVLGLSGIAGAGFFLSVTTLLEGFWGGAGLSKLDSIAAWSPLGWVAVWTLMAAGVMFAGAIVAHIIASQEGGTERAALGT